MEQIQFGSLPTLAKFGIGAGVLYVWSIFEREAVSYTHLTLPTILRV